MCYFPVEVWKRENNNRVCIEIELFILVVKDDIPCDYSIKYRSVIGYGTIEFLTDTSQKIKGLDIIMTHYGKKDKNIFQGKQINKIVILKLKIEKITGKQPGNRE